MKIVAIIPARAGSKGIPNKNIRLLNGRPLIYYAISNAIKSKMITDIIVSTDSPEIEIIAKQMGVKVKRRSEKLCGDNVTLDSVIYDAIERIECDWVVTMQPTSPTLLVGTLDLAIKFAIEKNLDTVISAINSPHLAWIEKNGKVVPAYHERLNRQYLPPYYLETGAFMISNRNIITETTRIGENVSVYNISAEEAVDVDTFEDLRYVSSLFKQQKVAIYVNGNNKRGMGHIYRALEVADEFYVKPSIFYDINQTERKYFGETTHEITGIDGIGELLKICREEQFDIFINDILDTSIDYMIALRNILPDAKIINFEDDGEGVYKADLVINALYSHSSLPQIKCGSKYYICSKLFMFYQPVMIKENVECIFISFGGADPQNYTDRLLDIVCKDSFADYNFIVVLGKAKENIEELMKFNQYDNINVYYDVKNMPEMMSECDIGITSRGRTSYELATLGIPSIVLSQNEREEKHSFISNDNGYVYLGINPSNYIIESTLDMMLNLSKEDRENYQNLLLKHDLKQGRERVMELINKL